ncbi:hypothetical protein B0H63DRAFT_515966 [Podospora didyma]|uniref:Hydrophobin n=1 Tax=Podospora didyma TaxID=330526 RepID=A0AAE0P3X0_9PEZI|nr:hypothetical protein B0H63DRAFT_515966 [Podospora didyma]
MKFLNALGLVLLPAVQKAVSFPTRDQVVLGGGGGKASSPPHQEHHLPVPVPEAMMTRGVGAGSSTTTYPTGMLIVTKTITKTLTRELAVAATAVASTSPGKVHLSSSSESLWDLLNPFSKKNNKTEGGSDCFCAGGSVCCHGGADMVLSCDYGICGI